MKQKPPCYTGPWRTWLNGAWRKSRTIDGRQQLISVSSCVRRRLRLSLRRLRGCPYWPLEREPPYSWPVVGIVLWRSRQAAPSNAALRLELDPPAGTEVSTSGGAAISPDGRMVAFVGH